MMYSYKDIKEVHLEITQRCQAACPMCDRNCNGGPDNPHITNAIIHILQMQSLRLKIVNVFLSLTLLNN